MPNIAYFHEEDDEEEILMGGVGVVPGGEIQPEYQDNLIAGRGLIPGNVKKKT